jgi:hypothetical protein
MLLPRATALRSSSKCSAGRMSCRGPPASPLWKAAEDEDAELRPDRRKRGGPPSRPPPGSSSLGGASRFGRRRRSRATSRVLASSARASSTSDLAPQARSGRRSGGHASGVPSVARGHCAGSRRPIGGRGLARCTSPTSGAMRFALPAVAMDVFSLSRSACEARSFCVVDRRNRNAVEKIMAATTRTSRYRSSGTNGSAARTAR